MNEQEEFWNKQLDNVLKDDGSEYQYDNEDEDDDVDAFVLGL